MMRVVSATTGDDDGNDDADNDTALDLNAVRTLVQAQVFLTHSFEYDMELPLYSDLGKATSSSSSSSKNKNKNNRKEASKSSSSARKQGNQADESLLVAQTELFDLWQRHRIGILRFLEDNPEHRDIIIEYAVAAATRKEFKRGKSTVAVWREHEPGRFVPEQDLLARAEFVPGGEASGKKFPGTYREWLLYSTTQTFKTEVNLQVGEFTVSMNQMQPIDSSILDLEDFVSVFGRSAKEQRLQVQCKEYLQRES